MNIKSLKPKLRSISGTVIDLTDVKPSKKERVVLIDRFICKQSKTNVHVDGTFQITTEESERIPKWIMNR